MSLSNEEKLSNYETIKHIQQVQLLLHSVIREILNRAENHDASKLESPEVEYFAKYTEHLAKLTYNSKEYNDAKLEMKPAMDHHYGHNRHHPEHFKLGINEMNLIDIIEMLCDWKASSMRHNNGNIRKSIEINADRFSMSPQLTKIIENTIDYLDSLKVK